jgi:hypothetical protein
MKVKRGLIFVNIINSILIFTSLILPSKIIADILCLLFFIQISSFFVYIYKFKSILLFLTPINLFLFYNSISFFFGSFAFANDIVLNLNDLNKFKDWEYLNYSSFYYLLSHLLLFNIDTKFYETYNKYANKIKGNNMKIYYGNTSIFILFIIIAYIFPINLSFLGGYGSTSYFITSLLYLYVIYYVSSTKNKYRIFIYVLLLLIGSIFSYSSKREIIFFVIPIIFCEVVFNKIILNFKIISKLIFLFFFLITLIIVMSIMRGYGSYIDDNESLISAFFLVSKYINDPQFFKFLFNNLEFNYTFYHSFQSIEYVIQNPDLLTYGSTLIKVLFIFFPRSIFGFKPDSIIAQYTSFHNIEFRDVGGSFPINLISEFFWNFSFFGIVFVIILGFIITKVFIFFLKNFGPNFLTISLLFIYTNLLMFYRGSGLDLYVVYIILFVFYLFLYNLIIKFLSYEN